MTYPSRRRIAALAGLALLPLASLPAPVSAETPASVAPREAEVRDALHAFFDAAARKDWPAIEDMLAADFEFYTDGSVVLTRKDFLDAMADDSMDIGRLEVRDVKIGLSRAADLAWVRYQVLLESSIKGEPYNMLSAETVVFRYEDARWRFVHNHASIKEFGDGSVVAAPAAQ